MAAKLICEVANEDEDVQVLLCDSFGFTALQGKVCINKMPVKVKDQLCKNPKLICTLREVDTMEKKRRFWCFPPMSGSNPNSKPHSGYSIGEELIKDFPDPAERWIGFICSGTHVKHHQNYSVVADELEHISSPIFESIKANTKRNISNKPATSFINKLSISPIRATTQGSSRVSAPVPVTIEVINKEEEEKLVSVSPNQDRNCTDFPAETSARNLIVEERDDNNTEEPAKFVSAGSGSESASKFPYPMIPRPAPLQLEDEGYVEIAERSSSKPGTTKAKASFNKNASGAAGKSPLITSTKASKMQPVQHFKKEAYYTKPKTARETNKKETVSLRTNIEKHFALKAVLEVNEKKSRAKKLNNTNNTKELVNFSSINQRNRNLFFWRIE